MKLRKKSCVYLILILASVFIYYNVKALNKYSFQSKKNANFIDSGSHMHQSLEIKKEKDWEEEAKEENEEKIKKKQVDWCYIDEWYFRTEGFYFPDLRTIYVSVLRNRAFMNKTVPNFLFEVTYLNELDEETTLILKTHRDRFILRAYLNISSEAKINFKVLKENSLQFCQIKITTKLYNIPYESKPYSYAYCSQFSQFSTEPAVLNLDFQLKLIKEYGYSKVIIYDFDYAPQFNDIRQKLLKVYEDNKDILEVRRFDYFPSFNSDKRYVSAFTEKFDEKSASDWDGFSIVILKTLLTDCFFNNYDRFRFMSPFEPDDIVYLRAVPLYEVGDSLTRNLTDYITNPQCLPEGTHLDKSIERIQREMPDEDVYGFTETLYISLDSLEQVCIEYRLNMSQSLNKAQAMEIRFMTKNQLGNLGKESQNVYIIKLDDELDHRSMEYVCVYYETKVKDQMAKYANFADLKSLLFNRFLIALNIPSRRWSKVLHNTSNSILFDSHRAYNLVKPNEQGQLALAGNPKGGGRYTLDVTYGSWAHFRRMLRKDFETNAKNFFIDSYYYECIFLKALEKFAKKDQLKDFDQQN